MVIQGTKSARFRVDSIYDIYPAYLELWIFNVKYLHGNAVDFLKNRVSDKKNKPLTQESQASKKAPSRPALAWRFCYGLELGGCTR